MLAQKRALVHVHKNAKYKGHADTHPPGLVDAPKHQHQRQHIGHPGGATPQAHVLQHVERQRSQQADPDEQ